MSFDGSASSPRDLLSPESGRPDGRPPRRSRRTRRRFGTLAALVILVAGGAFVATNGRLLTGRDAAATPPPTASPAAVTSSPVEPDEAWSDLALTPLTPLATLIPSNADRVGIARTASFTLTSKTTIDAVSLARGVSVVPAVALTVKPGPDANTAVLVPTAPLQAGTEYRFTLRTPDAALGGSWLFQTESPLHVDSTIPGDQGTEVPTSTGIEIHFDQNGVGPIAPFFAIEPAVEGSLEQHGRTWAFVPQKPLAPATIYTVAVKHGVTLQGSDQVLAQDFRFSFETLAEGQTPGGADERPLDASFPILMTEAVPSEPPVLEVQVDEPWSADDARKPLQSVDLRVFRLPGLPSAIEAYRRLTAAPNWAQRSDQLLVPTSGLPLVAAFTARIHSLDGPAYGAPLSYIEFPAALDRGWYLVVRPRSDARDQQVLLQVTDVAAYVTTTTTRSVVWVNDVTSGGPIAGATLSTVDGTTVATTAGDGTATPVLPAGSLFLVTAPDAGGVGRATKAGRALILPLIIGDQRPAECGYGGWWQPSEKYWSVLATDRVRFRPTDEIEAWGLVRPRNGGTATNLELRLTVESWECAMTAAERRALAVVRTPVTAGSTTGTFATPVAFRDLPVGWYRLELWAGDERVATRSIGIGDIAKPSYTFSVTTDRHVLVDGDRFTAMISSRFFDGTPLPALDVRVQGADVGERRATTTADGEIRLDLSATWGDDQREGSSDRGIYVSPLVPEQAEVPSQSTGYVVFPSRLLLDAKAVIDGDFLRITGEANSLDQVGAERQWLPSTGGHWDPKGQPLAAARVAVEVIETWMVPIRTGRSYDFISKQAFDTYRYERKGLTLARATVVTGPDGSFALSVARSAAGVTPPKGHDYRVLLSGRDADGRAVETERYAYAPWNEPTERSADETQVRLMFQVPPDDPRYSVGDEIRRTLRWRGAEPPTGGDNRYLYLTAMRGLQTVEVWPSPTFVHTFSESDIPNFQVDAVWFTGRHYVIAGASSVAFDSRDREINVALTPDKARHAPGDTVGVAVRTALPDGSPVAATVVLRAIDEKLYAIDAAWPEDPLYDTYQWVSSGVGLTVASHPLPAGRFGGGGGDASGGDGPPPPSRRDFRDAVLFQKITTGADGRGSVTFKLSDDVTSWRVSAAAFTRDLRVGQSSCSVAAGLPFIIEAPLADEYLVSDRPTLLVRAYGTALSSGHTVTFAVSSPTLGMARTTVRGPAFAHVAVPLPPLPVGEHQIRIEAASGTGASAVSDAVVRTIRVVETRLTRRQSTSVVLPAGLPVPRGAGLATYVFSDAGRGKYLDSLQRLAWTGGDRVDQALATLIAREVLQNAFSIEGDDGTPEPSLSRYQKEISNQSGDAGIALLPYAAPDLALSARVSLLASDRFDVWQLGGYFRRFLDETTSTREQMNLALAGLAGIDGQRSGPAEVAAALSDPDVTPRERLYLALAAATMGDHATALAVERDLLGTYGQRLGPWVRLRVSSSAEDILEATSLLALVAVTVGDPIAPSAEAYVEEHYSTEDVYQLQQAAFLRQAVAWAPAGAARFSYSIGGAHEVVDLKPGETRILRLSPAQAATLSAQALAGRVGVTVGWDEPTTTSGVGTDPGLSIERTVAPESPIAAGSVVKIVLTPRFGELTMTGCYRVIDLVPSGLRPLAWTYDSTAGSEDVPPWVIAGQKVIFCAWPGPGRPPRLVYYARVVTPGIYLWESAVMQSPRAPESGAMTPPRTITLE